MALVGLAAMTTAGCDLAAQFPDPDRKKTEPVPVQTVQTPPPPRAAFEMPEVLGSLARWDSAPAEQKRAAAAAITDKWSRFQFKELETFSAGGQTHEMALFTHEMTGLEFVLVPAGSFKMGSPRGERDRKSDEVQHEVILTEPFMISRTEVTQDAYVRKKPNESKHVNPQNPAESMSGYEAMRWARRYRLDFPTEAQWEYAARAGTTTAYAGGNGTSDLDSMGWYEGNAGGKPHAVAQKRPNAFGLYDVHGNVWEWTAGGWEKQYPPGTRTDPKGADTSGNDYRATRGGSWGNPAGPCRSAFRFETHLSDKHDALGFRVAKTLSWK